MTAPSNPTALSAAAWAVQLREALQRLIDADSRGKLHRDPLDTDWIFTAARKALAISVDEAIGQAYYLELEKDRVRLDWLTRYWDSQSTGIQPLATTKFYRNPTGSARDAIDAAMNLDAAATPPTKAASGS